VTDATDQPIAHVYFEDEPQRQMAAIARRGTADCGQHRRAAGPAATSSKVRVMAGTAPKDIASSWRSFHTAQEPKSSAKSKGGRLMVPVISANALLVWFVWGFFMAIGWALGTWVVARLLGMVWRERP